MHKHVEPALGRRQLRTLTSEDVSALTAKLNAKLLAVERELAADPLRTHFLEVMEARKSAKPKRRRPFKYRGPVVCHCGGAHRILPPDRVLEEWYARYKASANDLS